MKKLFFILISSPLLLNAQEVIMRQNAATGTQVPYYTNVSTLSQVVDVASPGDTIYLPGVAVPIGGTTLTINKLLHIIGAGHYPDASIAHGTTILEGTVAITNSASGGSISGINFQNTSATNKIDLRIGTNAGDQALTNYTISRCRSVNNFVMAYSNTSAGASNINISECIFKYVDGGNAVTNVNFKNCIINHQVQHFNSASVVFENCALIAYDYLINNIDNCSFMVVNKCILGGLGSKINCANCNFTYNLANGVEIAGTNNTVLKPEIVLNKIFVNLDANSSYTDFAYSQDWHLAPGSPGYVNGVEAGIYGGALPYKDKAIPRNPHIQRFSLQNNTVTVTVEAQTH